MVEVRLRLLYCLSESGVLCRLKVLVETLEQRTGPSRLSGSILGEGEVGSLVEDKGVF